VRFEVSGLGIRNLRVEGLGCMIQGDRCMFGVAGFGLRVSAVGV